MIAIPIQPLSVTIPTQAAQQVTSINMLTFHINSDGSGYLDFNMTTAAGAVVYTGSFPTTAVGLATAGCNLGTLSAALQSLILAATGATFV
jgi:hypothetical protein